AIGGLRLEIRRGIVKCQCHPYLLDLRLVSVPQAEPPHVRSQQPGTRSAGSHKGTLKNFLNASKGAQSWGMATSYTLGPFHLDVETRILFRGAEPLALGQRAVALLCALVERHGKPVSKDALIEAAWAGLTVEEGNLAVQIAALRRVLSEVPGGERWIE